MKALQASFPDLIQTEIILSAEIELYGCKNCNRPIDNCECACPYCGEAADCDCAIGHGKATGG